MSVAKIVIKNETSDKKRSKHSKCCEFKYYFAYYFDNYRQWANVQKCQLGYEGGRSIFLAATQAKFWPQRTVDQWYGLIEKAIDDIEAVKDIDKELYDNLYDHISADRLSPLYMMLVLYKDKYTKEEQALYKKQFADDTLRLGHNSSHVQAIYEQIGI